MLKLIQTATPTCKGCYYQKNSPCGGDTDKCINLEKGEYHIFKEVKPFFRNMWQMLTHRDELSESDRNDSEFQQGHYR